VLVAISATATIEIQAARRNNAPPLITVILTIEQFGAWSGAEGVQASSESALELIGSHRGSVRGREAGPRHRIYGRVTGVTWPCEAEPSLCPTTPETQKR